MSATVYSLLRQSVDLVRPEVPSIDFDDIALGLSRINRYLGQTEGPPLSVAEHLVRCSEVWSECLAPGGDDRQRLLAAYLLTHDFHEAYLGDDPTPKKRAIDSVAGEFGSLRDAVLETFAKLTERFDAAIHEAAGLAWPPPPDIERAVSLIDRSMLVTEWRDLRTGVPLPEAYRDVAPLPIKIEPWPWETARDRLAARMRELLPVFSAAAKTGTRS